MKRKLLVVLASALVFLGFSAISSFALTSTYVLGRPVQIPSGYGTPSQIHPTFVPVSGVPCIKRPACLDAHPSCMIAEPAGGWCNPTPTPFPTPIRCGGFIRNAPTCPTGYVCKLGKVPDEGGFCQPNVTVTPSVSLTPVREDRQLGNSGGNPVQIVFSNIVSFFAHLFHF